VSKVQKYAKFVVAICGFVGVVATQLASGSFDVSAIVTSGIALAAAFGVYRIPNLVGE